jgi:hypothetical protein
MNDTDTSIFDASPAGRGTGRPARECLSPLTGSTTVHVVALPALPL